MIGLNMQESRIEFRSFIIHTTAKDKEAAKFSIFVSFLIRSEIFKNEQRFTNTSE